jgi:hypothetical protein
VITVRMDVFFLIVSKRSQLSFDVEAMVILLEPKLTPLGGAGTS